MVSVNLHNEYLNMDSNCHFAPDEVLNLVMYGAPSYVLTFTFHLYLWEDIKLPSTEAVIIFGPMCSLR